MTGGTARGTLDLVHGDLTREIIGEYRADLIAEGRVIVETKVADQIARAHEMQLLNYLRATGIHVGLVLNFGPRPTFRRLLLSSPRKDPRASGPPPHDPCQRLS